MATRIHGTTLRPLVIACSLLAAPMVQGQDPQLARAAQAGGNYRECLDQAQQTMKQRWLRVECLYNGSKQAPDNRQLAVELLVACSEFVRKDYDSKNIGTARAYHREVKTYFGHDGFGFQRLRHDELPAAQRTALVELEHLLDRYCQADRQDPELEKEMEALLDQLADMDLPMPGGESAFTYCLKRDGHLPLRVLQAHARELKGTADIAPQLLDKAVRHDAPRIVNYLLNGEVGPPDGDMEMALMQLAVDNQASRVLHQWFRAQKAIDRVSLKNWSIYDTRHATPRAKAAVVVNDTTFLRYALGFGVQPDTLGRMVFRAMEAGSWDVLDVLLSAAPPEDATDRRGMSYLHKAFALDSPEALKSLARHGWLDRLAGAMDDEGTPAAHYLATMDLQRIIDDLGPIALLDMNTTDRNGFALLHKLVFRDSTELSIPAEEILGKLLKGINPKVLAKDKEGPHYKWTPLHYAARERRPELVKILVDADADRYVKDSYGKKGRSPKDVAKEYGFSDVLKAM